MITVTRISKLTGVTHTRDLPISAMQLAAWEDGGLAQDVFPDLPIHDREFLITGATPEEWQSFFGSEEGS